MTSQAYSDLHDELAKILPKSQHSKIEKIAELFHPDTINHVVLPRTHAGIETVELYGLKIRVDGNGHASGVTFPFGAEVLA